MNTIVISLGGSLVCPAEINIAFLKNFSKLIRSQKNRIVIVVGGGCTSRKYQTALKEIGVSHDKDLDMIGIPGTWLNARLVHGALGKSKLLESYDKIPNANILVAGGWKTGFSTDYCAAYIAKQIKASIVINMTNIEYVYDKDPKLKGAKIIKELSWSAYRKILGREWIPGMHAPFDPIAAKLGQKYKMKVIVLGNDLNNLSLCLQNKKFKGTTIF